MNPFELIKSISSSKKDILENEKEYNAFMVNRGLSYFPDTVIYANEMNKFHHLDGKLQYHFLINIVKTYYGYSNEKARDVLPLLSNDNLNTIKGRIQHGGIQR